MGSSEGAKNDVERGSPRELEICVVQSPRGFRLVGDLSSESAHLLAAALSVDGARDDVTLDLAGVAFVDTIGLHVIARAAAELDSGARIILLAPEPWLHKVLVLSGIDMFPNVDLLEPSS